jgi:hypothetical protein
MARSRKSTSRTRRKSGGSSRGRKGSGGGGIGALLLVALIGAGVYAYAHAHGGKLPDINSSAGGGGVTTPAHAPAGGAVPAGGTAFVFATGTTSEPLFYKFIDSARSSIDMTM